MTTIARVVAKWTGFSGAPGYSNFFWQLPGTDNWTVNDADQCTGAVYGFFNMAKGVLPPTVKIDVAGDVELIRSENAELIDVLALGTREQLVGTAASAGYSAATGAVVTWRTGGVKNGRRVRGRTFLVPCASSAFDPDGSLNTSAMGTIQSAAIGMRDNTGTADLGVWSRPSAVGASDGVWFATTGATVPDMGAVLRSRRN